MRPRVAVLIPCLDEEATIGRVVRDFRAALPEATVYVYDNGSTDQTRARAAEAGAVVCLEPLRGKGSVVRRMFANVDADAYVLVDGDDTYDAAAAPRLVERLFREELDMLTGCRVPVQEASYRAGHRSGNALLTWMVARLFGDRITDLLSGYRALSRRFVKSFPALAEGFETETELSVHALELRMALGEEPVAYRPRPASSASKLRTFRDGWRILWTIFLLLKEERPLQFFGVLFALLAGLSIAMAIPIVITYEQTGLVPRFPTAILATGTMLLAFLLLTAGLVLDSVARGRREMKRLAYLQVPTRSPLQQAGPPGDANR